MCASAQRVENQISFYCKSFLHIPFSPLIGNTVLLVPGTTDALSSSTPPSSCSPPSPLGIQVPPLTFLCSKSWNSPWLPTRVRPGGFQSFPWRVFSIKLTLVRNEIDFHLPTKLSAFFSSSTHVLCCIFIPFLPFKSLPHPKILAPMLAFLLKMSPISWRWTLSCHWY